MKNTFAHALAESNYFFGFRDKHVYLGEVYRSSGDVILMKFDALKMFDINQKRLLH
jgi:hypothetical protein